MTSRVDWVGHSSLHVYGMLTFGMGVTVATFRSLRPVLIIRLYKCPNSVVNVVIVLFLITVVVISFIPNDW